MAKRQQVKLIKEGLEVWAAWRAKNPKLRPELNAANLSGKDLSRADLSGGNLRLATLTRADLSEANLSGANLIRANLMGVNLSRAELRGANLSWANLSEADLSGADLMQVDLTGADLRGANLNGADLSEANFKGAILKGVTLIEADLSGTNFSDAAIGYATFGNNDLSTVKGLETVFHVGPSTIGIDTLYRSDGKIPEVFLRDAGIPEDFITFLPSLIGRAIEFYSCFISYSHNDEEYCHRLHSRMRRENLRAWYAPEDMKGGKKLHEEIFRAIQVHDKLLLVLSKSSMNSEWVTTEIRRARKVEREENRRKLFPIRLVEFEAIQKWECFDADSGKDLAIELREYYIPDFSNWKDDDSFEKEFAKLLRDLKTTET